MSSRSSTHASRSQIVLTGLIGLAATGVALCGAAEIITDSPPPAPRVEHAPPPRDGYVWGAGHWEWNRHAYVWVSGTWIVEHRGAHWVVDRWEPMGAQWHYVPGHWEHQS